MYEKIRAKYYKMFPKEVKDEILGKHIGIREVFRMLGEAVDDFAIGEDYLSLVVGSKFIHIDLSKTLNSQNEEVLEALYNLIK